MKHRILWLVSIVTIIPTLIAGCTGSNATMDYSRLVDELKKGGNTVQTDGEITQPFFTVNARVIKVSNEDVQVFEYKDEASMQAEASKVSPSGSPVGTTMVTWVAPPHFYKSGKLLVLYVGNNSTVTGALQSVLGTQFAGQ